MIIKTFGRISICLHEGLIGGCTLELRHLHSQVENLKLSYAICSLCINILSQLDGKNLETMMSVLDNIVFIAWFLQPAHRYRL